MTDNRTTELLRRLLDERGVEHYDGTESTLWLKDEHGYRASADELSSGRLSVHIWCDTPEQAIAATLGSEREKALEELVLRAERLLTAWDKAEWSCTPNEDKMGDYEPEGNLRVLQERIAALGLEVD